MSSHERYRAYLCSNPACRLRFPDFDEHRQKISVCPRCKSPLQLIPLPGEVESEINKQPTECKTRLSAMLDNIRSTFNVGAMFRTADGAGLRHLYLTGLTPPPSHPKISKTALGAEYAVPWTYAANGLDLANLLISDGKILWALEIENGAASIFSKDFTITPEDDVVLVAGNEVSGIDPNILDLCSQKIYIPMAGYKKSLNVAVAFGIAVYTLCNKNND